MDIDLVHNGVRITILDGPNIENGKPTALAMEHVGRIVEMLDDLRRFAAKKLLKMYNETWINDEIGPIDERGFVDRLINPSIDLYEIGYVLVYFDDSGLFAGHHVSVTVDNGVPTRAKI